MALGVLATERLFANLSRLASYDEWPVRHTLRTTPLGKSPDGMKTDWGGEGHGEGHVCISWLYTGTVPSVRSPFRVALRPDGPRGAHTCPQ